MFIRRIILFFIGFAIGFIIMNQITKPMLLAGIGYSKVEHKSYLLNKDSVQYYPLSEVLAAIAYHECFNLSKMERWLVMEAVVNRLEHNFNNNGPTIQDQLLAPKQFTGLWKFNPHQWKYDSSDTLCVQNKEMAELILEGSRVSVDTIYYWAGTCDSKTMHGKWVKQKHLKLPKNIQTLFR